MTRALCVTGGCDRPQYVRSRGLCRWHYELWRRAAKPEEKPTTLTLARRFIRRVIVTDTCWEFVGRHVSGYGSFPVDRVPVGAHRVSYELFVGPIPVGYQIDHLCRNRGCVRPDHLEAVTPQVNSVRSNSPSGLNSRKTTCVNGHQFDLIRSDGYRGCRTCHRDVERRRRAARRGVA